VMERIIAYGIWWNNKTPEHRRQFINLRRTVFAKQSARVYLFFFKSFSAI
jgi:hypothetical protein